jgi:regulator of replication initiation timing
MYPYFQRNEDLTKENGTLKEECRRLRLQNDRLRRVISLRVIPTRESMIDVCREIIKRSWGYTNTRFRSRKPINLLYIFN